MFHWLWLLVQHPVTLLSVGGALGTNARYWLGLCLQRSGSQVGFPWHTFVINVTGSLVLGVGVVVFFERLPSSYRDGFLLVGTGFCGGYTTFSSFSLEMLQLLRGGEPLLAGLYALGSVAAGVIAVLLGIALTRHWLP